jgi:diguanylate cyclase (GGDEF)-like protein
MLEELMQPLSVSMHPSQVAESLGPVVSEAERERLVAVRRYAILDTPPEGAFDRITRLAAQLFDVPIAVVSIIDHDRIWIKSAHGLEGVAQLPREPGLCSTAIEDTHPYILESADTDVRSKENSLVAGPFGLRFYVGIPLATTDGHNLGTLCVIDRESRDADPVKVEMLASLAKIVVDELELRLAAQRIAHESSRREAAEAGQAAAARSSLTDELTGLANRRALERELDAIAVAYQCGTARSGSLMLIDVDGLKAVNDRRGHEIGDRFLRHFALALVAAFPGQRIYRYGGDEFVLVCDERWSEQELRSAVHEAVRTVCDDGFPEVGASFGVAAFEDVHGSPHGALRLADSRMYAAKVARR